jgi:hypothetical protein
MRPLKKMIAAITALMSVATLVSCGGSTSGVAEYKTVNATASVDAASNPLLADLAIWSGDPCAEGSSYSIENNLVNITVTSTANITTGTSLPLMLQSATITFTPADSISPFLPSLFTPIYQNLNGTTLSPGGFVSIPIEVVTHRLKEYFGTTLICSPAAPIYSYNATISINAVEQGTGVSGSFSAGMTVRFADFAD